MAPAHPRAEFPSSQNRWTASATAEVCRSLVFRVPTPAPATNLTSPARPLLPLVRQPVAPCQYALGHAKTCPSSPPRSPPNSAPPNSFQLLTLAHLRELDATIGPV